MNEKRVWMLSSQTDRRESPFQPESEGRRPSVEP